MVTFSLNWNICVMKLTDHHGVLSWLHDVVCGSCPRGKTLKCYQFSLKICLATAVGYTALILPHHIDWCRVLDSLQLLSFGKVISFAFLQVLSEVLPPLDPLLSPHLNSIISTVTVQGTSKMDPRLWHRHHPGNICWLIHLFFYIWVFLFYNLSRFLNIYFKN